MCLLGLSGSVYLSLWCISVCMSVGMFVCLSESMSVVECVSISVFFSNSQEHERVPLI